MCQDLANDNDLNAGVSGPSQWQSFESWQAFPQSPQEHREVRPRAGEERSSSNTELAGCTVPSVCGLGWPTRCGRPRTASSWQGAGGHAEMPGCGSVWCPPTGAGDEHCPGCTVWHDLDKKSDAWSQPVCTFWSTCKKTSASEPLTATGKLYRNQNICTRKIKQKLCTTDCWQPQPSIRTQTSALFIATVPEEEKLKPLHCSLSQSQKKKNLNFCTVHRHSTRKKTKHLHHWLDLLLIHLLLLQKLTIVSDVRVWGLVRLKKGSLCRLFPTTFSTACCPVAASSLTVGQGGASCQL